jgi:ABC-type molybdenum transport system ATPase subunit/photorepair protein PhrA
LRLALLARALVGRPRLLLVERPEIGLDAGDITTLMLALGAAAAAGSCVLMTSSHPRLAAAAHRRISLDAPGRPEHVS